MSSTSEERARSLSFHLPPGVYRAVPRSSDVAHSGVVAAAAPRSSTERQEHSHQQAIASAFVSPSNRHRRLRSVMAAKEAALLELSQLIMDGFPQRSHIDSVEFQQTTEETKKNSLYGTDTVATTLSASPVESRVLAPCGVEAQKDHSLIYPYSTENGIQSAEKIQLEMLVHDLRRELQAAGRALSNQTAALKAISMDMVRVEPLRLVKMQRMQKGKYAPLKESLEMSEGLHDKLLAAEKDIKYLDGLLMAEKKHREAIEMRLAELQAIMPQMNANGVSDVSKSEDASSFSLVKRKPSPGSINVEQHEACALKAQRHSHGDSVYRLEKMHRAAHYTWSAKEEEFRRYIKILEATMMRMERQLPPENLERASLFNMTLRIIACTGLFNRRNNGSGFIDPFVVLYDPYGEKVLETFPCDNTDCLRFSKSEDATVTLKVARGSLWNVVVEVYSRGVNNVRLFLGQAKVPVGPLLEDVLRGVKERRMVKLRPREREQDSDILQCAHHLGEVVFAASATVVGAMAHSSTSYHTNSFAKRYISVKCDEEEEYDSKETIQRNNSCTSSTDLTISILGLKDFLKRGMGTQFRPYVVVYDTKGEELLRTPSTDGNTNSLWKKCSQACTTISSETIGEYMVFQVYYHVQDAKDEFLGETRLSKEQFLSKNEYFELVLYPHEEEESLLGTRKHRHRLGKLLVQCTRSQNKLHSNKFCARLEDDKTHKTRQIYDISNEPSKISTVCGNALADKAVEQYREVSLSFLIFQVTVESCRELPDSQRKGDVFVRILAPGSRTCVTSAVPQSPNPCWSKEEGSVTLTLHHLYHGLIRFYVIECGGDKEAEEHEIGFAQFEVAELSKLGFCRKELPLMDVTSKVDTSDPQHSSNYGSITISLSPLRANCIECTKDSKGSTANIETVDALPVSSSEVRPLLFLSSSSSSKETFAEKNPEYVSMGIYIKGGQDLMDCDRAMFDVLGVTDPRVTVWIGPERVFTTPEKRDTVNPTWEREEAEFIARVQSSQIIRFDVQDVDVAGFDSMGSATVHASEVIVSPGERRLPVLLHGKQYGALNVIFTVHS